MPQTKPASAKAPGTYLELIQRFPLTSIQSDAELDAATEMLDTLLRESLDEGGEMYLDALTDLVEHYESTHHPMPAASETDMLRYLMEANGLTQLQLALTVGMAPSTMSAVMRGARSLTKAHIFALARHFQIRPSAFMPDHREENEPVRPAAKAVDSAEILAKPRKRRSPRGVQPDA